MKAANTKVLLKKVPAKKDCAGCYFKSSGKVKCQKPYSFGYASKTCVIPKASIFVEAD